MESFAGFRLVLVIWWLYTDFWRGLMTFVKDLSGNTVLPMGDKDME